jgi:hypothetical protein
VLILGPDPTSYLPRRPTLGHRLNARLLADRLDRELATGITPEASLLHALHAQRIVRPRSCRTLGRSLRRILAAAGADTTSRVPTATPICQANVRAAATMLALVVQRLERNGPIQARGIASLRLLITNGGGPIYRADAPENLSIEAQTVLQYL